MLFLGSTCALSNYSPNQLAITPHSYISGMMYYDLSSLFSSGDYIEYDISIKILDFPSYPDISNKLVRFGMYYALTSDSDSSFNYEGYQYEQEALIWYHNRAVAIPLTYMKITSGSIFAEATLKHKDTFSDASNLSNMIVTLTDGRQFLWDDLQSISSLDMIDYSLVLGVRSTWYSFSLPQKFKYAISPESKIGEFVDYGWYNGSILEKTNLKIGSSNREILRVHIDPASSPVIYQDDGSTMRLSILESDFYYETKSGLIAGYKQYNETGYVYSEFIADEIYIAGFDTNKTIPSDYLFSLLGLGFMISLVFCYKKKK